MNLEIAETAPVIKAATATNRNKPAVLSNGVTVLVPEYLAAGGVVRINSEMVRFRVTVRNNSTILRRIFARLQGTYSRAYRDTCRWM